MPLIIDWILDASEEDVREQEENTRPFDRPAARKFDDDEDPSLPYVPAQKQ